MNLTFNLSWVFSFDSCSSCRGIELGDSYAFQAAAGMRIYCFGVGQGISMQPSGVCWRSNGCSWECCDVLGICCVLAVRWLAVTNFRDHFTAQYIHISQAGHIASAQKSRSLFETSSRYECLDCCVEICLRCKCLTRSTDSTAHLVSQNPGSLQTCSTHTDRVCLRRRNPEAGRGR